MFFCGVLAVLSSLAKAISTTILACAKEHGMSDAYLGIGDTVDPSRSATQCAQGLLCNAVCLFFQCVAAGCFVYACAWGPVVLAMTLGTATLLLWNSALQDMFQIGAFGRYRKEDYTAICVITCAVCCLARVGPEDQTPAGASNATAFYLLRTPIAMAWIACVFVTGVTSLVVMNMCRSETRQTIAYALFGAIATAVSATIGKFLTFITDSWFGVFVIGYVLCGVGALICSHLAAEKFDNTLFTASHECLKLIITALTGRFVWLDAPRDWLLYAGLYVNICLGLYIVIYYNSRFTSKI